MKLCPKCRTYHTHECLGVKPSISITHPISECCNGELCSICHLPATHKVGEEIQHDDPNPNRHNFTAYVCCFHFKMIFGQAVPCGKESAH